MSAPVSAFPHFNLEFVVDCNASNYSLGAVISKRQDSQEVITYASWVLNDCEQGYSTTKKEMLAMVYAVKHFHHYLYGRWFMVRTYHNTLRWLQSFKEPEGQVARWLELPSQYDNKIKCHPGKKHQNADTLSTTPLPDTETFQTNAVDNGDSTWFQGWTAADLQSRQAEDPDLKQIMSWKQCQTLQLAPEQLQDVSKAIRSLWVKWNRLELQKGTLYRCWKTGWLWYLVQLMLPRLLAPAVLSALHDAPSAGHLGVTKTLEWVREQFYWYGQQHDVEDRCQQCEEYTRRRSPQQLERALLVISCPGYPFERIALDLMGPLPTTETGNRHILVAGGYFTKTTKWKEAFFPS